MKERLQTGIALTATIIGMLLVVYLAYRLAAVGVLVLIAIVLTNGVDPLVQRLQRQRIHRAHIPRPLATCVVLLVGILILVGVLAFVIMTGITEFNRFSTETWPGLWEKTLVPWGMSLATRFHFPSPEIWVDRVGAQSGQIAAYLWSTTHAIFGFLGGVVSFLTVVILTFFFTVFKEGISYTFLQFVPPQHQARVSEVGHLAAKRMGGWLRGQLTLALIIASTTWLAMALLRMPYTPLIAMMAGCGEMIPMVGPYLGFAFALLVIGVVGGVVWWKIVVVIAFFILLAQLEGYVLGPAVMQRQVELPPITSILAILIGGSLLGIIGALLAIPLTAAGRVIMLEVVFPAIQRKSRQEIADGQPGHAPSVLVDELQL